MPVLALQGIAKRSLRGSTLTHASLSLDPHDFACVLGEKRSGKSMLLRIVAGLERPDTGTVLVDGRDLQQLGERERTRLRRREIGCVWRDAPAPLRDASLVDHVALPLLSDGTSRKAARARAVDALDLVGALACAEARMHELADVDRTRVAIAQAAIRRPRLLIADEPADTLDPIERRHIAGLLRRFADEGMAVLMTAVDADGAAGTNRLFALSAGRLMEASRPGGDVIPFPRAQGDGAARS